MMKKLLGVLTTVLMLVVLTSSVFAEYTDVDKNSFQYDSISLLSDMNVFSGYDDGSFMPDKTLTRAEFAKLIVMICDKEKEAKFNSYNSVFKDVEQGKWYVGYINYIASNQIIKGYADGTFGPDKPITYAEAITIMSRLLGYTEEIVGYYWPDNYVSQAKSLEITKGINFNPNDALQRGVAAVLIERVLFSDVPNSTTSIKLIEKLGYQIYENSYIIATGNENTSLTSKQIQTAVGVYELNDGVKMPKSGLAGTVVVNKNNKYCGIKNDGYVTETVYVTGIPDTNTIEYRTANGAVGKYKFDDSFQTYVNYNKSTYAQTSNAIDIDTQLVFGGKTYGQWEYAVIDNEVSGNIPVLASKNYTESDTYIGEDYINKINLKIYRNGEEAKLSDIKKNDVIYYNTRTNVIDVYNNKVTGIYTDAYPDKAHVTSVKVAGKTYELSSAGSAKNRLNASSTSFAIGEKVTLLLGKDDKVCFAVELTDFNYSDYGILLGCEKTVSDYGYNEGRSLITAEIFMPDGEIYTYTVDVDYDSYLKGKLVKLNYIDDKVKLTAVDESKMYGTLDVKNYKFAGKSILKDVKIINRLSSEEADTVSVEAVDFDTISIDYLNVNQVLNVVVDTSFGDIGIMYLTNLDTSYKTGYLMSSKLIGSGENSSYQYSIYADGMTTTHSNSAKYSANAREPVMYRLDGNSVAEIFNLKTVVTSSSIDAVEGGRIKISGKVYELADDVEIIFVEGTYSSGVNTLSVNELSKMKFSSVRLYAKQDKGTDSLIKAIVVR